MIKPLLLFVGKSGSGKTTIANMMEEKYGLSQLESYTTRARRYDSEIGHVFITNEEFDKLHNIVAYTEYNGNRYAATKELVDAADIYVIDVPGVKTLLELYDTDREIWIFHFGASVPTRIDRMIERGDCDHAILGRLMQDDKSNWAYDLEAFIFDFNKRVSFVLIDADQDQESVLGEIEGHIGLLAGRGIM